MPGSHPLPLLEYLPSAGCLARAGEGVGAMRAAMEPDCSSHWPLFFIPGSGHLAAFLRSSPRVTWPPPEYLFRRPAWVTLSGPCGCPAGESPPLPPPPNSSRIRPRQRPNGPRPSCTQEQARGHPPQSQEVSILRHLLRCVGNPPLTETGSVKAPVRLPLCRAAFFKRSPPATSDGH